MSGIHTWTLEECVPFTGRGSFRFALFDFDGTISLIRQGWQEVMKPYFFEVLRSAPDAEDDEGVMRCVHDFVDFSTGKQTIYQCISLAEEVAKRGGSPEEPQVYKDEYNRRLLKHIDHRVQALESGEAKAEDFIVPGSFALLEGLKARGITLYLASGTDEEYVLKESHLLGADKYFDGGIYGAQKDFKLFSKKMVIERIISQHGLHGSELMGFGDGYVEIENVREAGGFAVGVASDEKDKSGVDEWKRTRLISAGANIIIPHFADTKKLLDYLFPEV